MTPSDVSRPDPPAGGSALIDFRSHLRLWPVAAAGLTLDLWTKHLAFSSLPAEPSRGRVVIPHLMSLQRSLNTGALFGLGKGLTPVFIAASLLALAFVVFLFAHSSPRRWSLHVGLGLVLAGALGNLYDRAFEIADVVTYRVPLINKSTGEVREQWRTEVGKVVAGRPNSATHIEVRGEGGVYLGSWPEGTHPRLIPAAYEPKVTQKGVVRDFIRMEPRITIGQRMIDIWPWVFNIADSLLVAGVGLLMLNFWRDRKAEKTPAAPPAADATAT